ncbi:MAG: hypothetical protein JST04_03305 [Bdellovibrionales bacterium]|nr:hypothetical protein [Bdellovibrionales bacterium]
MKSPKTVRFVAFASLALLGGLALSGCGKDRTVDQYFAQKENEKQRQTSQSIEGTFEGTLLSKMNGKPMGALSVEIYGDTNIPDGSVQTKNVIAANITLSTKAFSRTINATNGFYNIYSHAYQLDFAIENGQVDATGKPRAIKFRFAGKLDPVTKVMDGTIQCVDYAKYGGRYRLTRGANSPQLEDTRIPTERAEATLGKIYSVTQEVLGTEQRVTMKFAEPTATPEGEFLELFYPVRFVTVSVTLTETKYGEDIMTIPFTNAEWDMDSRTLNGAMSGAAGSGGTQPYHFTLQCTESGSAKVPAWDCHWSGNVAFDFKAKAVR